MGRIVAIFLDMDGVQCDFWSAAVRVHGRDPEAITPEERAEGGMHKWLTDGDMAAFWAPIEDRGADFWYDLEEYEWGRELWEKCREIADTCILTSPSRLPAASAGKQAWIANYRDNTRKFLIGPEKYYVSSKNKVLVDDYEKNLEGWEKPKLATPGGIAVPFKKPWDPASNGYTWEEALVKLREIDEVT